MIVVKIGGAEGVAPAAVARDASELMRRGLQMVIVHGGSSEINALSERLGLEPRFITSPSGHQSRVTDRQTIDIVVMASAGKLNKLLVEELQRLGVNAVGVCGMDGRMLSGPRKKAIKAVVGSKTIIIRDDYSARIEKVDPTLVQVLLSSGYLPVVSSVGLSDESEAVNLDADRAAAALAGALKAEKVIFLTNTPGLLRDVEDESSVVGCIPRERIDEYAALARGRMKKKMLAAREALAAGAAEIVIGDGRGEHPLLDALDGRGTVIR